VSGAVLAGAGLLLLWCLFVLVSPVGRCTACKGTRVRTRNGRKAACGNCKATGRAARPGARIVHRAVWSVFLHDRMEGRRRGIAARAKKGRGS
jgi:hypothetical protein